MKKYIIPAIKFALSLGVGIGLIIWFMGQMSDSDKQHVIADIKRANYFWVAVPPVLGMVSNFFRTQRWRLLLRPLGYNPGYWNTFLSVMIMYFLNLFFPRLGEVSRCGVLARYEDVPLDKSIGTMVVERVIDVICLGLIAIALILLEHDKFSKLWDMIMSNSASTFGDIINKYQISPQVKYSVFGLVFIGILLFVFNQARRKGWGNIIATLQERARGLLKGVISVKDIGNPWEFVLHTVLIWICYFLMVYLSFQMFPETSGLGLLAAGVALFFGGVAQSLTPGGLGLFPIFTKIVLTLYGVMGSAAISLGLVNWTVQTISVLVIGVISLALLAIMNREPSLDKLTLKT